MVEFLNTTQARGEIERIISNAKYEVVMISPYIKINDDFISRISDTGRIRKVKMLLVCRKQDLKPGEREKLENLVNLDLRFNERLHAKCFYNEDTMVITSLNLYDSSLGDNREMGVLLKSTVEGDKKAFEEARNEAQFIIRECQSYASRLKRKQNEISQTLKVKAEYKPRAKTKPKKETRKEDSILKSISEFLGLNDSESDEGYCIHCGSTIPFNTDLPYCPKCFRQWNKHKNVNYKESYCNKCGNKSKTSKKYPLCRSCYEKLRQK